MFTLATDMIIGSAPPERAGAASALSETGSELGGALGIAILGSLGTALCRSVMAHTTLTGVPPDAAVAARDTLGGALAVASRLPDPLGIELLSAARGAFSQAMALAALISVAVVIVTAIIISRYTEPTNRVHSVAEH